MSRLLGRSFLAKDREVFGNLFGTFRNLEETLGFGPKARPAPVDAILMSLYINETALSEHKKLKTPRVTNIGIATLDTRSFFDFNQQNFHAAGPVIKVRSYQCVPEHMKGFGYLGKARLDPEDAAPAILNSMFIPDRNPEHPSAIPAASPPPPWRNIILVSHGDRVGNTISIMRRLGLAKKAPIVGVFDTRRLARAVLKTHDVLKSDSQIAEVRRRGKGSDMKKDFSAEILHDSQTVLSMLEELGVEIGEPSRSRFGRNPANDAPFNLLLMLMFMLKRAEIRQQGAELNPFQFAAAAATTTKKVDHLRAFIQSESGKLSSSVAFTTGYTGQRSEENKKAHEKLRQAARNEESLRDQMDHKLRRYVRFLRPKLLQQNKGPPKRTIQEAEKIDQGAFRIENAGNGLDPRGVMSSEAFLELMRSYERLGEEGDDGDNEQRDLSWIQGFDEIPTEAVNAILDKLDQENSRRR